MRITVAVGNPPDQDEGGFGGTNPDNVGLHLKNIFKSGELAKESVTEKISATASDGKKQIDTNV